MTALDRQGFIIANQSSIKNFKSDKEVLIDLGSTDLDCLMEFAIQLCKYVEMTQTE